MGWNRGEPEEADTRDCRVCQRNFDLNRHWPEQDICMDHNCHVAAGRERASPEERARAWGRIFREAIRREREEVAQAKKAKAEQADLFAREYRRFQEEIEALGK